MRQILGGEALAPKVEFHILSPPPSAAAAPPKCDAERCPWWPYSSSKDFKTNTSLVLVFLICTLICGFAFSAAIRYLIRLNCSRRGMPETGKADPGRSAAEGEAEIPAVVYSEGMKLADCAICLSEFAIGERIRVLERCGHGFHAPCVEQWLASHSSCPTCRATCSVRSNPSPP